MNNTFLYEANYVSKRMQLPPGCHLHYCAVAGCCVHKQSLGRNEGATMLNLKKWWLCGSSCFYIDITGTSQSVWPDCVIWLLSLVRNKLKPHGTHRLLRVIIYHGLLDMPLHWLSDLSGTRKEAIQFGRSSRPVIPPQQESSSGDTACVSGLPTAQFPLWNSHGFLELTDAVARDLIWSHCFQWLRTKILLNQSPALSLMGS